MQCGDCKKKNLELRTAMRLLLLLDVKGKQNHNVMFEVVYDDKYEAERICHYALNSLKTRNRDCQRQNPEDC